MAVDGPQGSRLDARVRVLDVSQDGLKVELRDPVTVGSTVEVDGEIAGVIGQASLNRKCQVVWCTTAPGGTYVAGLWFGEAGKGHKANGAVSASAVDTDYYELLQLSPNADVDTIHRVFRIMAQQYHPDNAATGNAKFFRELVAAHETLQDPVRRAAYDAQWEALKQTRIKIFHSWRDSCGMQAEMRKRNGILTLLYGKRMADAEQPTMSIREFEEMLGCPREHLEFGLWFLKEKRYITRTDNNRFAITIEGIEKAESEAAAEFVRRPALAAPEAPKPHS